MATFVDGTLSVDFDSFEVTMKGDPVQLPERECLFLVALALGAADPVDRRDFGQDVPVEPGPLRFEVEKAKMNWGAYLRDLMKPRFGGGFESYSGGGPSVVAVNGIGERRVIAVCRNVQEAKDKAAVVENEFTRLGAVEWCERYGVPQAFASG